jgi:hypothetical protein
MHDLPELGRPKEIPPQERLPAPRGAVSYTKWQEVPVAELRAWVIGLCESMTIETIAGLSGLFMTDVQDFVEGTVKPARRTIRLIGELYMRPPDAPTLRRPDKWLAERRLPQLRTLLPQGEDAALAFIDDFVRGKITEGPHHDAVLDWIEALTREEYAIEAPYRHLERNAGDVAKSDS